MATEAELRAKLEAIGTAVEDLAGDVSALHDRINQLVADQPVSQAQLDELTQLAESVRSRVSDVASRPVDEAPPGEPPPAGGDVPGEPGPGEQPPPGEPPADTGGGTGEEPPPGEPAPA